MMVGMKNFEIIEKWVGGGRLPINSININKSGISFGKEIMKILEKGAEIYLNREDNKVLFVPSEDRYKSFRIQRNSNSSSNIISKQALTNLKIGQYIAEIIEEGCLIKGAVKE